MNDKAVNIGVKLNNKTIRSIAINEPKMYDILKLKNRKPKDLFLETKSKIAVYSFAFR